MSDPTDEGEAAPRLSGDAAWRQHLDEVARRNAEASKGGKARREVDEQARDKRRRDADTREMARFMASRRSP
jgi:hypothetical protein